MEIKGRRQEGLVSLTEEGAGGEISEEESSTLFFSLNLSYNSRLVTDENH